MKIAKLLTAFITAALIVAAAALPANAAIASQPIGEDDIENATGAMTDRAEGTQFGWAFAGGENILRIADINDPQTKDYVIEGSKSLFWQNIGDNATADLLAPISTFGKGSACDFKSDKTYIVRFLLKQINPFGSKKDNLRVIVRTWAWEDPWVEFTMKADTSNNLTISVTMNAKMYEKGVIQKIGDNTYEVALRFNGVVNTTENYLAYYLEGKGGFAIDGMKVYESAEDPKNAFEKQAVAVEAPVSSSQSTEASSNSGSSSTVASKDESKTSSTVSKDSSSEAEETDGGTLSSGAVIALVLAGIVVIGCAVFAAIYLTRGGARPASENDRDKDEDKK